MRRPSEKVRARVKKVFEEDPNRSLRPAELVEKVGLQPNTVAKAVWDLIDSGELSFDRDRAIKLASDGSMNAALSV